MERADKAISTSPTIECPRVRAGFEDSLGLVELRLIDSDVLVSQYRGGHASSFCVHDITDHVHRGGRFAPAVSRHSFNTWCTKATAVDPSPTAAATLFWLPARTSPTAKMPGRLVSRR